MKTLRKLQLCEEQELGRYAFAPVRKDLDISEPNTPIEDELYDVLTKHFDDYQRPSSEKVKMIKSFLINDEYEDVFNEPDVDNVFRGMNVSLDVLEEFSDENIPKNEMIGTIIKSFEFKPFDAVSSWTTDIEIARAFSGKNITGQNRFAVVLVADVSKNRNCFISGPQGLYKVKGFDDYEEECEVLGFGKIKVDSLNWECIRCL